MKVIIIEDEKPAARRLARLIDEHNLAPEVTLHSIEESVKWLSENSHPDLIFLDIHLADGLSFEIFDHIDVKSQIIFTTAYDEYALKAFKLRSVDYLLKPIDPDELSAAINKFKELNDSFNKAQSLDIDSLKRMLTGDVKDYKKRFVVKVGEHLRTVNTEDIECFYSENRATFLYSNSRQNYPIDYSLEQLADILDPETFFRVSRKHFININFIKDIISYSNSRLKVILDNFDENEIVVSRERVKEFKDWLE